LQSDGLLYLADQSAACRCCCSLLPTVGCALQAPSYPTSKASCVLFNLKRVYSCMCGSVYTCTRYRPLPPAQHCCGRDPAGCQCLAAAALSALPAPKGTAHLQPFNKAACCLWVTTGVVAGHMRGWCWCCTGFARRLFESWAVSCCSYLHHPWL
jgi:hypothetical protein